MKESKRYTFSDAVRHFRATHMQTSLKGSTRHSYDHWLNALLVPRFGTAELDALGWNALATLDAELAADGLAPSTRCNIHSAFRSALRASTKVGMLKSMPALPPLPKVGRKVQKPLRRDDLEAILASASASARVVFELAAFTGLRPCEIRGLRWSDVAAALLSVAGSASRLEIEEHFHPPGGPLKPWGPHVGVSLFLDSKPDTTIVAPDDALDPPGPPPSPGDDPAIITTRATVVIDPGHGGSVNVGGSGANHAHGPTTGTLEKNLTLAMAKLVREKVAARGAAIQVELTRSADVNLSLADRAKVAKDLRADLFLASTSTRPTAPPAASKP